MSTRTLEEIAEDFSADQVELEHRWREADVDHLFDEEEQQTALEHHYAQMIHEGRMER